MNQLFRNTAWILIAGLAFLSVSVGTVACAADDASAPAPQSDTAKTAGTAATPAAGGINFLYGAAFGSGLIMIGAGYGFGRLGSSAVESMARQPEVAGNIQTAMIIVAAIIEGATFFALVVCLLDVLT